MRKPAAGFPVRAQSLRLIPCAQFSRCWQCAGDLPDVSNPLNPELIGRRGISRSLLHNRECCTTDF
jgi:hypothetical protein